MTMHRILAATVKEDIIAILARATPAQLKRLACEILQAPGNLGVNW